MKPLVSVIIPVYNRVSMLKDAIESVKKQTYKKIELIIADDGSTDGTIDYIKHTPYLYIKLKHTGLAGYVRNMGAKAASGTYLAFLDSDDLWHPEKIQKQVAFFDTHQELIICHTREIWNKNGKIISQANQNQQREGDIFKDALIKCIIGPSTVMIKRNYFIVEGMFREDLEIAEDYEFWLRICARYKIGYIDESLITKRGGHTDQLSAKYDYIEQFRIKALQINIDNNFFTREQQIDAINELIRKLLIYANGCLKRKKEEEGNIYKELIVQYKKKLEDIINK